MQVAIDCRSIRQRLSGVGEYIEQHPVVLTAFARDVQGDGDYMKVSALKPFTTL